MSGGKEREKRKEKCQRVENEEINQENLFVRQKGKSVQFASICGRRSKIREKFRQWTLLWQHDF